MNAQWSSLGTCPVELLRNLRVKGTLRLWKPLLSQHTRWQARQSTPSTSVVDLDGELTSGTFRRELRTVEARQPMAVRVGYSPSDTMCWSASKFLSSNRTQLEGDKQGKVTSEPSLCYTYQIA